MTSTRSATVVGPGEGTVIDVTGDRYRILASREGTDGSYALIEAIVPPGGGPPPHLHRREEEGFYVLEGELALYIDGERVLGKPGTFVNMPKGTTHWFRNETSSNVKMIFLVAPAGFEKMLVEVGTPVRDRKAPIAPAGAEEKALLVEKAPGYGIELKIPAPH